MCNLIGTISQDDFCQWCGRFVHEDLHHDELGLSYCKECFESLKEIENDYKRKSGRNQQGFINYTR